MQLSSQFSSSLQAWMHLPKVAPLSSMQMFQSLFVSKCYKLKYSELIYSWNKEIFILITLNLTVADRVATAITAVNTSDLTWTTWKQFRNTVKHICSIDLLHIMYSGTTRNRTIVFECSAIFAYLQIFRYLLIFLNSCSCVRIFAEHKRTLKHWTKIFNAWWPLALTLDTLGLIANAFAYTGHITFTFNKA